MTVHVPGMFHQKQLSFCGGFHCVYMFHFFISAVTRMYYLLRIEDDADCVDSSLMNGNIVF